MLRLRKAFRSESDLYKEEPAGVEQGDWYTNKTQEVVGIMNNEKVISLLKNHSD